MKSHLSHKKKKVPEWLNFTYISSLDSVPGVKIYLYATIDKSISQSLDAILFF